ncbi:DNA primase [Turicimonas muris]|uniref:DNA primase n=1 Tax=Turicimonas muris TaxID=1796652 RepID=UPI0025B6AFAA|nr:DNA primase [Turicimonas muris]
MFIAQSFIKDLLERVDIFDTINRRITLKVKGENGWACCPFHNEKTSSFSVSRQKQFYHCFGCGEHGNAISFLMKYEGLDFTSAVEKLAQENGLQVRYEGNPVKRNPEAPRLVDLMGKAQEYYRSKLQTNPSALKYITDRGLTAETIEKFRIGFAPDNWRNLSEIFGSANTKYLIEAGLQREGKNGNEPYDFFRNRLMFPIRNVRGQVIAFSARTMTGEEPKYINTGETPIFKKGSEVFGLYEAQRFIREKNRAIVVEGQMDVIQLSQAGFKEACAPLGTAIRSEHVERLLKVTDHVIFSFDGDNAGRKAARRAMELTLPLLKEAQKASFLFLPEGEDPDSYVKNYGAPEFEKLLSQAQPLSSYLIDNLSEGLDLKVPEDKSEFLSAAAPLVRSISNSLYRSAVLSNIAKAAGVNDVRVLAAQLGVSLPAAASAPDRRFRGGFQPWIPQNAAHSNYGFQKRRVAPEKNRLLRTVLRNFVLYPQLAVLYEKAATELFSTIESETAQTILSLIAIIFKESEDGYSIQNSLISIPDPLSPQFEETVEAARSLILTIVSLEEGKELIQEELIRGRDLGTNYFAAEKETQTIFFKFELEHIEEEKKNLLSAELTEEDKDLLRVYQNKAKLLKAQIQDLTKKISKDLQ